MLARLWPAVAGRYADLPINEQTLADKPADAMPQLRRVTDAWLAAHDVQPLSLVEAEADPDEAPELEFDEIADFFARYA